MKLGQQVGTPTLVVNSDVTKIAQVIIFWWLYQILSDLKFFGIF